ncbi:MAG: hypothetical protein B7X76_07760 [Azorhizobium sp. 39-67-5]|nr:MAG: hypothetical protein B7X76_07760 [Azorhizobium sp. 39-67-5]
MRHVGGFHFRRQLDLAHVGAGRGGGAGGGLQRRVGAGIGLVGPGLDNWLAARPILAGTIPYESRPLTVAAPPLAI